jgi:hypothetical protein
VVIILYIAAAQATFKADATIRGINMAVKKARPNWGSGIKLAGAIIPFSKDVVITAKGKLNRFKAENTAAKMAISTAITKCRGIVNGNPANKLVNRWPKAAAAAPCAGPSKRAARKPGAESKATVPVGLGTLILAPTALRAINIAIRVRFLIFWFCILMHSFYVLNFTR